MTSNENMIQSVLDHLVEGEQGQLKGFEKFLQGSIDVERDVEMLLKLEFVRRRVSQKAMDRFVRALPQLEWIVLACDIMLQQGNRWNALAIARTLHEAMGYASGKTQMLAEMCWIQRLDATTRAVVSNSPVSISSNIGSNIMYAAGDSYVRDRINRSVFCWHGQWTADQNQELWRFVPVSTGSPNFYIVSVYSEEYLYASVVSVPSANGISMKRVFVRRENHLPDDSGIWRLAKSKGDTYTLCNVHYASFLASPVNTPDGSRRDVVVTPLRPFDETTSVCREWEITAAAPTQMERGVDEFFARKYNDAVRTFTSELAMEGLSVADFAKVTCYRMAANLVLNNEGCFKEDHDTLNATGELPNYFFSAAANHMTENDREMLTHRPELYLSPRSSQQRGAHGVSEAP